MSRKYKNFKWFVGKIFRFRECWKMRNLRKYDKYLCTVRFCCVNVWVIFFFLLLRFTILILSFSLFLYVLLVAMSISLTLCEEHTREDDVDVVLDVKVILNFLDRMHNLLHLLRRVVRVLRVVQYVRWSVKIINFTPRRYILPYLATIKLIEV